MIEWKQIDPHHWECESGGYLYQLGQSLKGFYVLGRSRRGRGTQHRRWIIDKSYVVERYETIEAAFAAIDAPPAGRGGGE